MRVRWLDWNTPKALLLPPAQSPSPSPPPPPASASPSNAHQHGAAAAAARVPAAAAAGRVPAAAAAAAARVSARFAMSAADHRLFEDEVEILLAADVVYVDEWTTSFAHAAHQLLSHLFTTPRFGSITAADNTTTTTTTDTTQRASSDGGGGGGRSRSTPASGSGSSTAQSAAKSSSAQKQQTPMPTRTRTRTRTLFLTIEKRINFSLDDLAPAAPAYEHFVREMVQSPLFNATRLPIDFAQRFQGYTRVPQLELWMFTSAGGADR